MAESSGSRGALFLLLLIYAGARMLELFPTHVPVVLIVVLHVLPPALFAFIHGSRVYGTRGILMFAAFCLTVGSFFESLSLRTGFPFGHYYFTGVMGPKLFQLPILLALAYLGVGYLAWVLASLIVAAPPGSRAALVFVPVTATFAMCAWDLAMDPTWANIDHAWVWLGGGGYFGVPFSNFFGWLLTTWVFYQLFALWLRRRPAPVSNPAWNRRAVIMYGLVAAGNLLLAIPSSVPQSFPRLITDAAGRQWFTSDIVGVAILVSLFLMAPFAIIAWARSIRAPGGAGAAQSQFDTSRLRFPVG